MATADRRFPKLVLATLLTLAAAALPIPLAVPPALAQGMGMGGRGMGMRGASDSHFIIMMIPHHEGAIAMAELALRRAQHPELRELARSISVSQARENAQMRGWYRDWFGGEVPRWGGSYGRSVYSGWSGWVGQGCCGGMGGGPAMMGSTDLRWLEQAPDFDRAFIEQMIPHHRMGVMMASMALGRAEHPELARLEEAIIRTQTEEIARMEGWYRSWYGQP